MSIDIYTYLIVCPLVFLSGFVVCPMVEENEELPVKLKSAQEHAAQLAAVFPELKIGCVHGRMKAKDKEQTMAAFVAGEIDILVATTVIEVGVDVPNATLMVIEDADRFGLSCWRSIVCWL